MGKKIFLFVILIAVSCGGAFYYIMHQGRETTDDAFITAHIVPIIPKVAGYVTAVHVTDNQRVKKGDLLLEIDPADFQIKVDRARAGLTAIESRGTSAGISLQTTLTTAGTTVVAAEANVKAAAAAVERAASELKRLQGIGPEYVSKREMDNAIAADRDARARLEDARAQRTAAGTAPNTVKIAESSVGEAQAMRDYVRTDLATAERDLAHTKIYAAEDGVISKKNIEPGQYVQTGQMLAALVTPERWVVANFKETQLAGIAPGKKVEIDMDAYPDLHLTGTVDSIQHGTGAVFSPFPPENATGNFVKIVQRVPVKILLAEQIPDNVVAGPGMSVIATVMTK